jgi:hypothetical protein
MDRATRQSESLRQSVRIRPRYVRFPFFWRILAAAVLTLFLGFGAVLVTVERILESAVTAEISARVGVSQNALGELLQNLGTPAIVKGQLRFGEWIANGDNSVVDHVKQLTGADATLFQMMHGIPVRVTTTIIKLDGSGRNVGTELLGPARRAVDEHRSFAGVSPVAGRDFINRYDLLRDRHGHIIGVVYSGVPLTTRDATAAQIMHAVVASTICTLPICIGLMYFVTDPIRRLFDRTIKVADGLGACRSMHVDRFGAECFDDTRRDEGATP